MTTAPIVEMKDVHVRFTGERTVHALNGIDIALKQGEVLVIGDDITVTVLGVSGDVVRIGIQAPRNVTVHREEIWNRIKEAVAEA